MGIIGRGGTGGQGIHPGELALRGERCILQMAAVDMLRLKRTPFYPYLRQRTLALMSTDGEQPEMVAGGNIFVEFASPGSCEHGIPEFVWGVVDFDKRRKSR